MRQAGKPATMYVAATHDKDGNLLEAVKAYSLTVPKDVHLNKNTDGSFALYVGPKTPKDMRITGSTRIPYLMFASTVRRMRSTTRPSSCLMWSWSSN